MARYVKKLAVDGVICGHIHVAAIKAIDGITYINCGDCVDSCTAILEHHDGQMELIEWAGHPRRVEAEAAHHDRPTSEPSPVTGPAWTPPLARRGQAAKDVTEPNMVQLLPLTASLIPLPPPKGRKRPLC